MQLGLCLEVLGGSQPWKCLDNFTRFNPNHEPEKRSVKSGCRGMKRGVHSPVTQTRPARASLTASRVSGRTFGARELGMWHT